MDYCSIWSSNDSTANYIPIYSSPYYSRYSIHKGTGDNEWCNKGLDKGTWIASYQNKFDKVSQIILAS